MVLTLSFNHSDVCCIKCLKAESAISLYPVVLSLYGHWLGETRSHNPVQIMEKYLEPVSSLV